MANTAIELKEDDVLEIDFVSTQVYKATLADGKTENKLAGQEYHRFGYRNKIFTSRDANFKTALDKGDLFKVVLEEVVDGDATYLQLVSFITYTKKNGLELNKTKLRGIMNMEYKPTAVTEELLQDIS